MEKTMKRAGALVLSAALVLGTLTAVPEAKAAARAKKLTVKCSKKTLYVGGPASEKSVKLKVKVTPKKASKKVKYKSSNKKVATVSKKGKITAKKVGKATITVTSKSNKKLKKKIKITVKKYTNGGGSTDTDKNPVITAAPTGSGDSNATPAPTGSADSTATPTPTGSGDSTATPAPTGSGDSTATPVPTNNPGVEIPATDIALSNSSVSLTKSGTKPYPTKELKLTVTPENATSEITWTSTDESIATVENGIVTAVGTGQATITALTDNGKSAECSVNVKKFTTAIHDPSIFKDPNSDNYYTVGTALGMSVSQDLQAWSSAKSGANLFKDGLNALNVLFNYTKYDGDDKVGAIWAADLIYNTAMQKYCMYVCANCGSGYGFRTAIGMYSSADVTGPYEWEGMVVCADFTKEDLADTNIVDALGLSSVDEVPSYYYDESEAKGKDSLYFKNNFPDCIDPAPFYDADGTLYMVYGSFTCFGGIRILKLDPNTGLRNKDYNYKYEKGVSDPYFGKRLTDKSGEGPYILRVPSAKSSTGNYYFLWTSSGLLRGTGNYRMSMFRSEHADGPYEDIGGMAATSGGGSVMTYNYKFSFMKMAYTAMGGNSALRDEDGKLYLVYHNKFEDNSPNPGTHMLKIHQMFLNEDGWLVAAPFEYHNETIAESYTVADVAGDYELVKHQIGTAVNVGNYNYNISKAAKLNPDGTVSGAVTGTWTLTGNKITITEGGTTYKGVVCEQYEDDGKTGAVTSNDKTMVITMLGTNKVNIWASKVTATDEQSVTYDEAQLSVPEEAKDSFNLVTSGLYGSAISWTSDNKAITINGSTAEVNPQVADTTVTLTATVTKADQTTEKTFTVIVPAFELSVPSVVGGDHIDLPDQMADGTAITWESSDTSVIKEDGTVVQPDTEYANVTLTATIGDAKQTYEVVVLPKTPAEPIYEIDFTGETDASKYLKAPNYQEGAAIRPDADYGSYLEYSAGGQNSRGATYDFGVSEKAKGIYTVEFDVMLRAGNDQTTEFALSGTDKVYYNKIVNDGIESGYIFKLSSDKSTTWTLNGKDSFELPDNWVHMKAIVDAEHGKALLTISSSNGSQIYYDSTVAINGSGILEGFYLRSGRKNALFKMDNIKVY